MRIALCLIALSFFVLALPSLARGAPAGTASDFWHRNQLTDDWWGLRARLEREGISIDSRLTLDGFDNFLGGKRTGITGASTFDFSVDVDTAKLLNLPGGDLYIDLENHAGGNPSYNLVGDLQVFDRLSFHAYLEIFELWYQQEFFGGKFRIKFGKIDANTDFAVVTNGQMFLNSSAQLEPTLFILPTTPAPASGFSVFYRPNRLLYAGFGVYNANRGDNYLVIYGTPQDFQHTSGGALLIGESGSNWRHFPRLHTDGDFRFGLWAHTGKFEEFDGGSRYGAEGVYAILDQTLWRPVPGYDDQRGLRSFVEYGYTDRRVSPIYQHAGGGITWTGLFGRSGDTVGFGPECAFLSPDADLPRSYELSLETFYRLRFTPWASIQPDLQYILNPGGRYPDALVATIRAEITF